MDLKKYIRDIKDFPKPGIVFKDICPLLHEPKALAFAAEKLAEGWGEVHHVAGIESRGFIFGVLVAQRLGVGFIPIRKPGKLPYQTVKQSYSLEYGTDTLEVHVDAVKKGQRVLIVDDLLATGGTLSASCDLIEKVGGVIAGCAVVTELSFLEGRKRVGKRELRAVISY